MKTWKLTLEYDGTKYSGWQEQRNARTVQGVLRQAAEELFLAAVELQGAGRTDAGVHALAQVAHLRVKAASRRQPAEILSGLNELLPADVVVLSVEPAPASFHARHDAILRTYRYQISTRKTAFAKRQVWWVRRPLDVAAMSRAAGLLVGRHNFECFRAVDPSRPDESPIVVVESANVQQQEHLIVFRIQASHFLWRMVRRIAGVLVKLGCGELGWDDFQKLLDGRCDPKLDVAAWTAPAAGLLLESVTYAEPAPPRLRPQSRRRRLG